MFGNRNRQAKLRALEQELLEADEAREEWEEEYEDPEADMESDDFEEEYDEEQEIEEAFRTVPLKQYARGSARRFDDDDFFESGFDDEDVLYRRDYKKAKRKQRRKKLGLFILALAELAGFAALILWWTTWKN